MKSRDTVHLYRGPSSWSLWPTMDNSWRVTREVIYEQETLLMLVIFANMNSSGQFFFFFFFHLASFPYFSGKSLILAHWFSHSSAASKAGNIYTFSPLHFQHRQWDAQAKPFIFRIKSYPGVLIREGKAMRGTGIIGMSCTFSRSLPDNQERLWFSFLYTQRPPLELSHSKLNIPVPAHTMFWTDGCITLLQTEKNLKVGKERLEECVLKKSRARKEINLPTNTHTVSWQSYWLFYQIAMYQHIFHYLRSSKLWSWYH